MHFCFPHCSSINLWIDSPILPYDVRCTSENRIWLECRHRRRQCTHRCTIEISPVTIRGKRAVIHCAVCTVRWPSFCICWIFSVQKQIALRQSNTFSYQTETFLLEFTQIKENRKFSKLRPPYCAHLTTCPHNANISLFFYISFHLNGMEMNWILVVNLTFYLFHQSRLGKKK